MEQPTKPIVLFLCTGNSCRSQMAEGFLRKLAGDQYDVHSAGTEAKGEIHPLAIKVMVEKGIDLAGQYPKGIEKYLGRLPVRRLIIVCGGAEEKCPRVFPGILTREFWPFDDPAAYTGPAEGALFEFRAIRDQIEGRIKQWLREQGQA